MIYYYDVWTLQKSAINHTSHKKLYQSKLKDANEIDGENTNSFVWRAAEIVNM